MRVFLVISLLKSCTLTLYYLEEINVSNTTHGHKTMTHHTLKNTVRSFNMKGSSLFIALAVCIFTLCLLPSTASTSSVPELINYQGKLTDAQGQPLATGEYGLAFGIYATANGGTAIWTEPHTNVPVVRGHFNVILGGITSGLANAFASSERYLEIKITANPQGPVTPHQVIAPRQRILSAPYAIKSQHAKEADVAANAEKLNERKLSDLLQIIARDAASPHKLMFKEELPSVSGTFAYNNWFNWKTIPFHLKSKAELLILLQTHPEYGQRSTASVLFFRYQLRRSGGSVFYESKLLRAIGIYDGRTASVTLADNVALNEGNYEIIIQFLSGHAGDDNVTLRGSHSYISILALPAF